MSKSMKRWAKRRRLAAEYALWRKAGLTPQDIKARLLGHMWTRANRHLNPYRPAMVRSVTRGGYCVIRFHSGEHRFLLRGHGYKEDRRVT